MMKIIGWDKRYDEYENRGLGLSIEVGR